MKRAELDVRGLLLPKVGLIGFVRRNGAEKVGFWRDIEGEWLRLEIRVVVSLMGGIGARQGCSGAGGERRLSRRIVGPPVLGAWLRAAGAGGARRGEIELETREFFLFLWFGGLRAGAAFCARCGDDNTLTWDVVLVGVGAVQRKSETYAVD